MMKLRVGFDSYTFVRTNVMRSLLLKKEDYHKLLKMSVSEITKRLQEMQYKEDISALGGAYSTTELIEMALSRNLDRSFKKLRRISDGNIYLLIDAYLQRYDIQNIKTLLRALKTKQDKKEAELLLSDAGKYSVEYYKDALNSDSVEDALKKLETNILLEKVNLEELDGDLIKIENELQKQYYSTLLGLANRMPRRMILFKEFLQSEIRTQNLLMLVRLKREEIDPETISSLMISPSENIKKMIPLTLEDVFKFLQEHHPNKFDQGITEFNKTGSLIDFERILNSELLRKSVRLLHQDLLSVNSIFGFMFAKEVEVRNLRVLVKGKKFNVNTEFIEKELVV